DTSTGPSVKPGSRQSAAAATWDAAARGPAENTPASSAWRQTRGAPAIRYSPRSIRTSRPARTNLSTASLDRPAPVSWSWRSRPCCPAAMAPIGPYMARVKQRGTTLTLLGAANRCWSGFLPRERGWGYTAVRRSGGLGVADFELLAGDGDEEGGGFGDELVVVGGLGFD